MVRNVRTYDHFCILARSLEQVGDRWSLLVIRDLLSGPKRFTDLMERLGGITPKTLTQRLRELESAGILDVDREAGRREVRYQLTASGVDLAPAVEALAWWGWRHRWRLPQSSEAVHPEHVLLALNLVLNQEATGSAAACWHFQFLDDGDYTIRNDGRRWALTSAPPSDPADVTVVATTASWLEFVRDPTAQRAKASGIEITGKSHAVRRLHQLVRKFSTEAATRPTQR